MHISRLGIVVLAVVDQLPPDHKLWPLGLATLLIGAKPAGQRDRRQPRPAAGNARLFVLVAAIVWLRLGPRWGIGILAAGAAGFLIAAGLVFQRDPQSLVLVQDFLFGSWSEDWTDSNAGIRLE